MIFRYHTHWEADIKSGVVDILSEVFDGVEEKKQQTDVLEYDYYCIKDENNTLYIKSDLFVMMVFLKGSDWGEDLFLKLFGNKSSKTEVIERLELSENDTVFNIQHDSQSFDSGIIIKTPVKTQHTTEKKETQKKSISLPVVIRLFHKKIPLSDIDSIGETSEVLISSSNTFNVDLLMNGKVIGKGVLKKEDERFRLKITEIYI